MENLYLSIEKSGKPGKSYIMATFPCVCNEEKIQVDTIGEVVYRHLKNILTKEEKISVPGVFSEKKPFETCDFSEYQGGYRVFGSSGGGLGLDISVEFYLNSAKPIAGERDREIARTAILEHLADSYKKQKRSLKGEIKRISEMAEVESVNLGFELPKSHELVSCERQLSQVEQTLENISKIPVEFQLPAKGLESRI